MFMQVYTEGDPLDREEDPSFNPTEIGWDDIGGVSLCLVCLCVRVSVCPCVLVSVCLNFLCVCGLRIRMSMPRVSVCVRV